MTTSIMKNSFLAIADSIISYPSCIYWLDTLSFLSLYLYSFTTFLRQSPILKCPFIYDLMVFSVTKINFKIQAFLSTILTILNFHYLQNYYRKSHDHSSEEVKTRLNAYLIVLAVSDIIYIISLHFMCFIDIKQHPIYQSIFSILFFLTHPFIHLIPKGIVRLRHVNRSLYGYSLINTGVLLTIVGSPFLIYARYYNAKDSISWMISGALFSFAYLLNGLSFIFDAITVLGHRFIRFYLYFPQEKTKHTRRVVVV